ncbi:hypothetical protein AJ79_08849 [Helicocarpus griseus UAMH5409]|uniref:F-box domain-containing protein n=1 Tax=Helicocarpus griseus UAMH5409 TaxID=1447875 RepID=A0A2B7WPR3_9EURO|nr:hypothetical protein AJ79_08849 [Helicocarpus griseus UAMH5409]
MNKHDSALQTYQYALRVLNPGCTGYQQIKELAAKLDRRLNGPKLTDPFTVLPLELVSLILEYLDLASLLSAVRVSKHWSVLLNSFPKLWSHLDLSKARRRAVSLKSIQAFLRRSRWGLTRATLVNIRPDDYPKLMTGLNQIRSLEHLELHGSFKTGFEVAPVYTLTRLKTLICSELSAMSVLHFGRILSECLLLERAEVHLQSAPLAEYQSFPARLPHLRSLTIVESGDVRNRAVVSPLSLPFIGDATLFDITPNLEELYLIHKTSPEMNGMPEISNLPNLKRLGLLGTILNSFPALPESLERLSLSKSLHNPRAVQPLTTANLSDMAPNLKTLILHQFRASEIGTFLITFTQNKPSLTHLDLEGCHLPVEDLLITMMHGNLENVTSLNISGLAEIDDRVMANIIDMMPNIKQLDISRAQVKEHSAKRLISSDNLKLERLVVHKMETPFSREFLDYAKSKGVEIPPPIHHNGVVSAPSFEPRR